MRNLIALAFLTASAPAYAGGIGIFGHGGLHTEKVVFYSDHTIDADEDPIADPADWPQISQRQFIPQFGGGFEFILGDRDDRVTGVFRGYYSVDVAQSNPGDVTTAVNPDYVVSAHREQSRHVGIASMGLNWGIVGNPEKFQFGASAHIGAGILTSDHTEFFQASVGPTINYRLTPSITGFADVQYLARFRKSIEHGGNAIVGMRLMFD